MGEKRDHEETCSDRALNPCLPNMSIITHVMKHAGVALTVYTCIRKEHRSNLGRKTCKPNRPAARLSPFSPAKQRRKYSYLALMTTASFQTRPNLSFINHSITRHYIHCIVVDTGTVHKRLLNNPLHTECTPSPRMNEESRKSRRWSISEVAHTSVAAVCSIRTKSPAQ